jgi:transmembrane sensor
MLNQDDIGRIKRYTEGNTDDTDYDYLNSVFQDGDKNNDLRRLLRRDWDVFMEDSSLTSDDLTRILDRIHHIIRTKESLNQERPVFKLMRVYMKVAAVLLIPILVAAGIIFYYSQKEIKPLADQTVSSTIYAPYGSRVSFNLPDGTRGMLNSGSRLSYSLPFSSKRQIDLEGEAWFEVKHDVEHPFNVTAGKSTIKVLGTSFNVNAFPSENYIEVVLQTGKLEFAGKDENKKVIMSPCEKIVLQNDSIQKSIVDPAKYSGWTRGKLIFRGDRMAEVCRRIERWYSVKVELADPGLMKYSFRGTFEDDKLEEVLRYIAMTSPIRYKIIPGKVMADGICEKEKVIIYLK